MIEHNESLHNQNEIWKPKITMNLRDGLVLPDSLKLIYPIRGIKVAPI